MKKICMCLSLMMCMMTSCQKDEDVVPEPQPEPETKPVSVKYAEYETTDDYIDFGVGNFMIATKNHGAKKPEDVGNFYAWGETEPKEGRYEWESYKWCASIYEGNRDYSKFSKYVTDSKWGEMDGKTRLEPEDDAAHVFMGGEWRMPTPDEFQELADKCTFEVVTLLGHSVIKVTGPNGNCIYFPKAGSTSVVDEIYCWTSDMTPAANHHAICYHIQSFWATVFKMWEDRCAGLTVRAVCP